MWKLSIGRDSRIYQNTTIPDLVKSIIEDDFEGVVVNAENLQSEYEIREFLVQYQESKLVFIMRIIEEKGIFFFLDYSDKNHETLFLYDSMRCLPYTDSSLNGKIHYTNHPSQLSGQEYACLLQSGQQVGANSTIVHGYDWTNPTRDVEYSILDEEEQENFKTVYDHVDSIQLSRYSSGRYQFDDSERSAQILKEILELQRKAWGTDQIEGMSFTV